jgi:transcriptional regulator with XRE-family HTH domain
MYLKRLKDLREDNDYTQTFIASYLNMKQQQYSRYETGEYELPLECLIKLSKLYKVSTDYILNLTDKKYRN